MFGEVCDGHPSSCLGVMTVAISRGVTVARVRLPVIDHKISRPTTENLTLLMPEGGRSLKTKKKDDDHGRQAADVATVIPRKEKERRIEKGEKLNIYALRINASGNARRPQNRSAVLRTAAENSRIEGPANCVVRNTKTRPGD